QPPAPVVVVRGGRRAPAGTHGRARHGGDAKARRRHRDFRPGAARYRRDHRRRDDAAARLLGGYAREHPGLARGAVNGAALGAGVPAGADCLQVDEPSVTLLPRDGKEMIDLVNRTFAGITVKKALHSCFGTSFGRPRGYKRTYRPLFPYLLEAQVDQISLEF